MSEKEAPVSVGKIDDFYLIEGSIKRWRQGVIGIIGLLVAIYVVYFYFWLGQEAAIDAEKWGQFGDFIGGLLNPLVAFAAFYWLTQSVKLQKQELGDTRKALEDSAAAQVEQADSSRRSVRIGALSALLNSVQSDLATQESLLNNFLVGQPVGSLQNQYYFQIHSEDIDNARAEIVSLKEKKSALEDKLRLVLGNAI